MRRSCPICAANSDVNPPHLNCERCGNIYFLKHGDTAMIETAFQQKLGDWDARSVHRRSRLSYVVRRSQHDSGSFFGFDFYNFEQWDLDAPLPSPAEQLNNLILWIGDSQPSPAESATVSVPELAARLGIAINRTHRDAGLGWLLSQEQTRDLIENRTEGRADGHLHLRLWFTGFERYHALKRGRVESRKAFMAMKFGASDVERAYNDCFRPAVARAGFELFDLRDQQRAGMIDDHMRVAIRNSRFTIADLSYGCRGSYWEGGFAEGLGRPVIYTCEAAKWEAERPHFDANHLATVIWSAENFGEAARLLTAIIRNMLPGEAKMEG